MLGILAKSQRRTKKTIALAYDAIAISFSLYAAICLRLSTLNPDIRPIDYLFLSSAPILAIGVFWQFGLYRTVIRYATYRAFVAIFLGLCVATVALIGSSFFAYTFVPRSVPIIFLFVSVFLVSLPRLVIRNVVHIFRPSERIPVLIFGAGENAIDLANSLLKDRTFYPAAFIDNNPYLTGNTYSGIPVFLEKQIPELIEHRNIRRVFIATQDESKKERLRIVRSLEKFPVRVQTIPAFRDIISGKATISEIHDVDIVELLGRDPVIPDIELMQEHIAGKNVLVTGAGGSIGSELCRQIVKFQPKLLILFDCSEFNLYQIYEEFCQNGVIEHGEKYAKNLTILPVLGNIQDHRNFVEILSRNRIQTIYHSAAYKHVPIVETNTFEAINNNLFGTLCCVESAIKCKVETFVLISTDKAVRPTSIMGASKRLAEMVLQALAERQKHTTLCMVRFGNVLNSSGSVVPKFRQQINDGGPVTVTHPDITRYFMTTKEAAQLVIQAGALAKGGDVFVLEMGEPVKIVDLAKEMILLSGMTIKDDSYPGGDIEIKYTGIRPGEKLFEELIIGENWQPTSHPRILRAEEFSLNWNELSDLLNQIKSYCDNGDYKALQTTLMTCPIAYSPSHLLKGGNSSTKDDSSKSSLKLVSN